MTLEPIYQGFTWRHRVRLLLDGDAPDITADTVTLTLVDQASGAKAVFTATPAQPGVATFELAPADTQPLAPGRHWFELAWFRADGAAFLLANGEVDVKQRQTPDQF